MLKNNIYHYTGNFSDEFLANLNKKAKKYRIGTTVICADGIRINRVRGKFADPRPKGLKYWIGDTSSFQVL